MRHFKRFVLAVLVALVGSLSVSAHDFEAVNEGSTIRYRITSDDDLTCAVTYNEYSGIVVIPSSVEYNGKTYSVTSIGNYAFQKCTGLTSITISNSVTSIGYKAFEECTGLTLITIPNSVTSIGGYAFCNCTGLILITIPNSVTLIGDYAFHNCTGLTSITIPNSVVSIEKGVFCGCSRLFSITIPNSVTSIAGLAFNDCIGLTSITIPNSVTSIDDYAFSGSNIRKLMLGTGLTTSTNAFKHIPIEKIYVSWTTPAGLNIYNDAFSDVYKITLYVPIGCTRNYETCSPWNNFKEIKEYMPGGNEGNEKCAAPTISVENNNLMFSSITPNAKFYYTIDCDDVASLSNSEYGIVKLNATYNIKAYAYAEGYDNSETVSAILVWVNPTIQDSNNIISMEAKKAVVIKTVGGNIYICGTGQGERIQLYSASGMLLNNSAAVDGETTIPYSLQRGETYIIKYGDKSIKYQY